MHVENVLLRWPFSNPQASVVYTDGSPNQGTNSVQTAATSFSISDPAGAKWEQIAQSVHVARPKDHGPLMGISIAPDSPIGQCDIMLAPGGNADLASMRRVSVGNPYVGQIDVNTVLVGLPIAMPQIGGAQTTGNVLWDGSLILIPALSASPLWQYPLKLQLWYGQVPIVTAKRAPLHARTIMSIPAANTTSLYVITDGRRRTVIDVFTNGANRSINIFEMNATKLLGGAPFVDLVIPLSISGVIAIPVGTLKRLTLVDSIVSGGPNFQGGPWPLIRVDIIDTVGSANLVQLDVWSYD